MADRAAATANEPGDEPTLQGSGGVGRRTERMLRLSGRTRQGRRRGLYDHVVDVVGEQIVNSVIPVGTTLYVEQICSQLDISRSVVREGVRTLSSMGLVEARPQRGTRVQPRTEWDLLHPRVVQWRGEGPEHLQQMYELLELRLGVEQSAAHFAALRMDTGERAAVRAAGREMEQAYAAQDPHRFFSADAQLHRLVLEGAGNPMIARFADTVASSLQIRGTYASRSYSTADSLDSCSASRHAALAEAVAAGEPEAAGRAAAAVVTATLAEVGEILARRNAGGDR